MGSKMSSLSSTSLKWDRLTFIQYHPFSKALSFRHVTVEKMPEFAAEFKDVIVKNIWSPESINHRRFLLIETSHGFFSIEPGKRCINVLFSFTKADLVKETDGELRLLSEFQNDQNKFQYSSLKEILEWIHKNNKFKNGHNSFFNLCNIL